MKKYVLGVLLGCLLMAVGCKDGQKEGNIQDVQENAASQKETITIMHIDAEAPGFLEFPALQMQISGRQKYLLFWRQGRLQWIFFL